MNVKSQKILILSFIVALLLFLTACGGGGGGDDGGSSAIVYSGPEGQASITQDNAQDLTVRAYQNSSSSLGIQVSGVQQAAAASGVPRMGRPYALLISDQMASVLDTVRSFDGGETLIMGTDLSGTEEITGSCGGQATITMNVNDETGDFSGNVQYDSFCEAGAVIDGRVNFSGKLDDDESTLSFDATFDALTVRLCDESMTSTGRMSMSVPFFSPTYDMTVDMLVKDNDSGKVYWINDVAMRVMEASTYTEITESGRFYDPDYGFVELTTTSPVRIYDGDFWPSRGVVVVEGSSGLAGGSTRARLTMLDSSTYRIQADTNGDGGYDYEAVESWPDESLCLDTGGDGTFSSPVPVSINQPYAKTISAEGSNYYSFVTGSAGTYTIALTNVTRGVDLDWDLLDADGRVIRSCVNDVPSGEEICSVILPGNSRYILLVDNYSGAANFTLTISGA